MIDPLGSQPSYSFKQIISYDFGLIENMDVCGESIVFYYSRSNLFLWSISQTRDPVFRYSLPFHEGYEYYTVFAELKYIPSRCYQSRYMMIPMRNKDTGSYRVFIYDVTASAHRSLLLSFDSKIEGRTILKLDPYVLG